MMKKTILLLSLSLSLLLNVGCSSSMPSKHYYQLTSDFSASEKLQPNTTDKIIFLESVDVAEYLNQTGIVYQTNEVEYVTANNNLWLTSLSNQIEQRVLQDLSVLIPEYVVTNKVIAQPTYRIKLFIDAFNGNYQGDVVIKGHWLIVNSKNQLTTKPFDYTFRQQEDGYNALVKTLSKAWQEELIDLAKMIK